jgi:hypothetical protein
MSKALSGPYFLLFILSASFALPAISMAQVTHIVTAHANMDGVIRVIAMETAELELHSIDVSDVLFAEGEALTIDSVIHNSGAAASGDFKISFHASADTEITADDPLLSFDLINDIGSGESFIHRAIVLIPDSIPAGEYFIGAIVAFADSDQTDNVNFDRTAVTLTGIFTINAGLNDAWVSADAPFQGVFFTVFPDLEFFFLAWFTFDSVVPDNDVTAVFGAPDQRWVTAGGSYSGNTVTLNVELTSGGIFNDSEPMASQQSDYGTITMLFMNCNEAVLTYDFPSTGLSQTMTLMRVVPDGIALCQALSGS